MATTGSSSLRCYLLALLLSPSATCWGQQATLEDPKPPPKKNWSEEVKRSAERIAVYATAEAEEPLQAVTAYKWSNAARPRVLGDRLCLLFVHQGRPVASCKVYPTGQSIVHAFVAFTELPLVARHNSTVVWSPPPLGLERMRIPGAPQPYASAGRRRIQMKSLARQFTAETGPGEARRQSTVPQLRLLPNPLYRYQVRDEGPSDWRIRA